MHWKVDKADSGRAGLEADDGTMSMTALEMHGISKAFGEILALDDVSLAIRWGEVHALLGENGAGKSTIMNIATGVYAADGGRIDIDGRTVEISSPVEATKYGLGMVHQHFRLVPSFSVAENVLLACCRRRDRIRTLRAAADEVRAMGARVGLPVDPHSKVDRLSIAEKQRAEILKVLLLGARIIILDEPTAVLTDQESEAFLAFVRTLAERGNAVILITHKLREVTGFSDRVTVMRRGKAVLSGASTKDLNVDVLAECMVGEQVAPVDPPREASGEEALRIVDLVVPDRGGGVGVDGLNLALNGGEILGLAGVGGNGQQPLADCLMGLVSPARGTIKLGGRDATRRDAFARRRAGLRSIPSDRFSAGLVADMSVAENYALPRVRAGDYGGRLRLLRSAMDRDASKAIEAYSIAGATPDRSTRLLSGGNAQKLILARELTGEADVLVAHSPTRGLDVRACNVVHTVIKQAVEAGAACLLISEDMDEILTLSTRIAVISRGRIAATFRASEATSARIGRAMLGHA